MEAAPEMAAAADDRQATPLFVAVTKCGPALVRELLQAAPQTATQPGPAGVFPLEAAILYGREDTARVLLQAAPEAARQRGQEHGVVPLHQAAERGLAGLVALLLQLAPETALAPDDDGALPLHLAAVRGHADVVRLLLDAAPAAAAVADNDGQPPYFYGAQAEDPAHAAAVVRLLLGAAREAAAARNQNSLTALHLSCVLGNAEAARLLVEAAPDTAVQPDAEAEYIPLQGALEIAEALLRDGETAQAARCAEAAGATLAAVPAAVSLPILRRYRGSLGRRALPLFTELATHWPLDEAQWQHLPSHRGGLGRALPAVLARSEAEARLLVAHLPAADRQRLQACALCLHRLQNRLRVHLPPSAVRRILALFDA